VSLRESVKALKELPLTAEEVDRKPAVRLIDFYEGLCYEEGRLPRLDMERTLAGVRR
jgi:hypothetical protein